MKEEEEKVKNADLSLVHESVTEDEIARIISRWTGIPVAKLTESERNKTLHLDDELHKRVVGQDEAVEKVTDAIIRSKAGSRIRQSRSAPSCSSDLPVSARQSLQRRLRQVCLMMRTIWSGSI